MRRSPLAALPGVGRLRSDRTVRRVVALALVGLLARLVRLGGRVAHYDEGRVAWWAARYAETGQFEYRYIIHGPLVQHANARLFPLLGRSDAVMRLPVALVGAALPLAALLFRDRLADDEVVAVAFFLSLNPVLLYYSRFFRSTLLVAAFSFVAFGLLVRAYDRGSPRYVYAAAVAMALAFASKENAVVYLLVWIGAAALLADHALFSLRGEESGVAWLRSRVAGQSSRLRTALPQYLGHAVLAVGLFLALSLFFFAPRNPGTDAPGLWSAVADPTLLPDVVGRTVDDVVEGYGYWFGGSTEPGCRKDNLAAAYGCFLGRALETMGNYALPLSLLGLFGFVAERWARADPRPLVLFAGYWGIASVIGYPLGTDIANGWITVNAIVPLVIPAGVGLALVVRWGRRADRDGDAVRVGAAAFVVLLVLGQMAVAGATGVYDDETADENPLVQYAQPADDFRRALQMLDERAAEHDGTDVLFVGSSYVREMPRSGGIEPRCSRIRNALPIQWYVAVHGAEGDCARSVENATEHATTERPLVVIAPADEGRRLAPALDGYQSETHRLRSRGSEATFFYRTPNGTR